MIYQDKDAKDDTIECPACRGTPCLNCGKSWLNHKNWSCMKYNIAGNRFCDLSPEQRYLTQSMRDSMNASASATIVTEDRPVKTIDDNSLYTFFAAPQDGYCICGISKASGLCKYH